MEVPPWMDIRQIKLKTVGKCACVFVVGFVILRFLYERKSLSSMDAEEYLLDTFPAGFSWCTATSSYQIEGAWKEGGKGLSVWDTFSHLPGKIKGGDTGDVACDSYHKWREDVKLLKQLGVTHYRFSLSWPRILPNGRKDHVNQEGIDYYNHLIDALLEASIQPIVTIYHWDHPQALEDLGGWLNAAMPDYFNDYATICFDKFGDRVKWWASINEPYVVVRYGYVNGKFAPGKSDKPGTDPYIAGKNMLLAHAKAYHTYDEDFRPQQKGKLSIVLQAAWYQPYDGTNPADQKAARRSLQFELGWFAHPLYKGNYPPEMIERIDALSKEQGVSKSRLPGLSKDEVEFIKGTTDYFGLNHYSSRLVKDVKNQPLNPPSYKSDTGVEKLTDQEWPGGHEVPWGVRRLLNWIKDEYRNPPVFIMENGMGLTDDSLEDLARVQYYRRYLDQILKAIKLEGCQVIGYTAWSLMDNFEWYDGYSVRFGLHQVDFDDEERKRTPRKSAEFYAKVIRENGFPEPKTD